MRTSCVKNVLVVGVILLFIGVGFQPAFAVTKDRNNNPPDAPEIYGPVRWPVNVEIEFAFSSTDRDGDDVKYYIDWGDGAEEETSYYQSGEIVIVCHTYEEIETYLLRAKAIDIYGYESEWSSYYITINEDDCNLCAKKVSKSHLVFIKSLLDRLEKYDNQISELSKPNPQLEEKYQELSKRITFLTYGSDEDNPFYCDILDMIIITLILHHILLEHLFEILNEIPIIRGILNVRLGIAEGVITGLILYSISINCHEFPWEY